MKSPINIIKNEYRFRFCMPYDIHDLLLIESKKQEVPINHVIISAIISHFGDRYDFSEMKKIHEQIRLFNISKHGWMIIGFVEKMTDRIHDFMKRHEAKNRELPYDILQDQIKKDLAVVYVTLPHNVIESNYKIIHTFTQCSQDIIKMKNYCNYLRTREPNRFMILKKRD